MNDRVELQKETLWLIKIGFVGEKRLKNPRLHCDSIGRHVSFPLSKLGQGKKTV